MNNNFNNLSNHFISWFISWMKSRIYNSINVLRFPYLGSLLNNQNSIHEGTKCRLKAGDSCYYSVQILLSSRFLSKNLKIKILQYGNNIAICSIWMWNMVYYIKGEIQTKGIWKQDPEANIWAQVRCEWGIQKGPQWGTS